MSQSDPMLLHPSSQSDIDEIESLMSISVPPLPPFTNPAKPFSPPRASIPVTPSTLPVPPALPPRTPTSAAPPSFSPHEQPSPPQVPNFGSDAPTGFGGGPATSSTLTEPVWLTVKRDLLRILINLRHVVFPNPYREDPGQALRDWDLWGPFFFIVFLGIAISSVASADNSRVFAVVFAVLAVGAVILTLNVLLLGGHIIFFQSLSLLGYCLFPLDIAALICMIGSHVIIKGIVVLITLAWSSWAAYPFVSAAVSPNRKALAVYPVLLLYVSIAFFIFAV